MWRRRRRNQAEPVVLPSLDRLSGLVERVVELVEQVGDAAPEPVPEPPGGQPPAEAPAAWVAFAASPHGYRLVESGGAPPARGDVIELDGAQHRVVKVGPSPLPGDRRPCAHVEREEAPQSERTSDA